MAEVKASLEAAVRDASTGMITTEFVAQYIDKIFVSITECSTARFDIKIFTGKTTEKWFKKLAARSKGRTGNTSNAMTQPFFSST
ncbi:MAG: hypothetical protein IJW51_05315 [Clostridia bacterium]|nr:hypothetical protein [Clostridia bacterium]